MKKLVEKWKKIIDNIQTIDYRYLHQLEEDKERLIKENKSLIETKEEALRLMREAKEEARQIKIAIMQNRTIKDLKKEVGIK